MPSADEVAVQENQLSIAYNAAEGGGGGGGDSIIMIMMGAGTYSILKVKIDDKI